MNPTVKMGLQNFINKKLEKKAEQKARSSVDKALGGRGNETDAEGDGEEVRNSRILFLLFWHLNSKISARGKISV